MQTDESDVVIAGHSHYFRQLIKDYLVREGKDDNADPLTCAQLKKFSKDCMANTQVLMIDFTGAQSDGKYVVSKVRTVYDPEKPNAKIPENIFGNHPCDDIDATETVTRKRHPSTILLPPVTASENSSEKHMSPRQEMKRHAIRMHRDFGSIV